MRRIGQCSLDCLKQLLPNLAASGLWASIPALAATTAVAGAGTAVAAIPLAAGLACVAAYIGLTRICKKKPDEEEQRDLQHALEVIRRRSSHAERELRDLGFHLNMNVADIGKRLIGIDVAVEDLRRHLARGFSDLDSALDDYFQKHIDRFDDLMFFLWRSFEELKALQQPLAALPADAATLKKDIEESLAAVRRIEVTQAQHTAEHAAHGAGLARLETGQQGLAAKADAILNTTTESAGQLRQIVDLIAERQLAADSSEAEINDAVSLIRQQKYTEALTLLRNLRERRWALLSSPNRYRVLANMGISRQAIEDYEEAAELFIEARQFDPAREQARCFEALAWSLREEHDIAFKLAAEITTDFPSSTLAWSIWVKSAPDTRSFDDIENSVPSHIRDDAEVACALSVRAAQSNRLNESASYARRALVDCPDNPNVRAQAATATLQALSATLRPSYSDSVPPESVPMIRDAIEHLGSALAAIGGFASAKRRARLLLNRAAAYRLLGDHECAEHDNREAYETAPNTPEAAIRWAYELADKRDLDGAIRVLQLARSAGSTPELDAVTAWALNKRALGSDRDDAIAILTARFDSLATAGSSLASECVGTLFQVYVETERYDDAEKLLQKAVPSIIPEPLGFVLRACMHDRRGTQDDARGSLRQAFSRRAELREPEHLLTLGGHLQRLGLYQEALAVWKTISSSSALGPPVFNRLLCAQQVGDDADILSFCAQLRAHGFEERPFIDLETFTLAKYGEYDAAFNVLTQALDKTTDEEFKKFLRLRRSALAVQLGRTSLVESDPRNLPAAMTVATKEIPALVCVLRNGPNPAAAAQLAYTAVRKHFGEAQAHAGMIAALMAPIGPDVKLPESQTIKPGFAAIYRDGGAESPVRFFIIEDESNPDIERGELAPDHPIALELMGRKAGDSFTINPGGINKRKATIVEVVHKCVARLRDSLSGWESRFPKEMFVKEVRLDKKPDGNLDFSPILKSIDERVRSVEQVEQIYREQLLPLHVFSARFGRNVFDAMVHVASRPGLRIRCSFGTQEERQQAMARIAAAPAIVIDITALATLFALDAVDILESIPSLVVSQSTLDALTNVREELSKRVSGGFLGKDEGRYTFANYESDAARKGIEDARANLDRILGRLQAHADIRSGLPLAALDPKHRDELIQLFGQPTAESILIASQNQLPLWADDLTVGLVATERRGVDRVWTFVMSQALVDRNAIPASRHIDLSIRLVCSGYDQTPVWAETVVQSAIRSEWDPEKAPILNIIDELASPNLSQQTLPRVIGNSLAQMWRRQSIEGQAANVAFRLLEKISARPGGTRILQAVAGMLDAFFGFDVVGCAAARHVFQRVRGIPSIIIP